MSNIVIMGKRKEGDEEGRGDQPTMKRPRRAAAQGNITQQMRLCQDILETLRNHRTEDGRLLAENFLRAPSRRIAPEYHKLVASPIDLMRIQQKIKNEEYDAVEQFVTDIKNLSENAKSFYKKSSTEYKDAVELWQLFLDLKLRFLDIGDEVSEASGRSRDSSPAQSTRSLRSNSPGRSTRSKDSPGRFSLSGGDTLDRSHLEAFFAGLLQLTDENGRNICLAFRQLPTKDEYPEYYNVITNPIDLKMIAGKLRKSDYKSFNDIQRDLSLMCRNAKTFNEPKSTIYKDANFLKKAIESRKAEFLESATRPLDKSRSLHAAAVIGELLQSALDERMQTADTVDDYRENSDEEDIKPSSSAGDNFWRIYWTVRNWKEGDQQVPISEPFCRLPSRKVYPDYYDEIKNPISLFIINRKIKNEEYDRFVEIIDDLNLMFNNAKFYNVEGSVIFNEACGAFETADVIAQHPAQLHKSGGAACQLQAVTNRLALQIDPTIDVSQYNVELPAETPTEEGDETDESGGAPSGAKSGRGATAKSRLPKGNAEETSKSCRSKLLAAYNAVVNYKDKEGRWVAEAFMEKPPRKLYPDYYQVIPDPIDLKTIKADIDADRYESVSALEADVELLFSNARHYNEENSQIYNDAVVLESVFKGTVEKLGDSGTDTLSKEKSGKWSKQKSQMSSIGRPRSSGSASTPAADQSESSKTTKRSGVIIKRRNMRALYEAINNYTDAKGNKLSPIFSKLPSKADYPDYYDIIKKPIDLQKIHSRLTSKSYETLESLVQDFNLMFDNACKYNDPESTIYKSALTLQRALLQKKAELQDEEMDGKVPDVQTAVQELLTNIFIAVYNHEDEEGRCLSDSLVELPDLMKDAEPDAALVSLDDIKHKLDKGRYRRLDRFQQDVFEVFNKARQLSRSDSQLFEDATDLQQYFIIVRNELCKNGQGFTSPALKFSETDLAQLVEEQQKLKQPGERSEDDVRSDDPRLSPSKRKDGDTELQNVAINGIAYAKGDFVYVKPNDEKLERHIIRVERIWRDEGLRQEFISGNWYYRPYETYHRATRKFLEKEVFRTEFYDSVDAQRLLGKCYVMFVKDYFKFRPSEIEDEDVYVCESKYMGRIRHFKKIKYWHIDMEAERVTFVERTKSAAASRVPSVFSSSQGSELPRTDDHDEEEEDYSTLERKQEEIMMGSEEPSNDGNVYYEKINFNGYWFKIGDGAYVRAQDGDKKELYLIERLWRSPQGDSYLSGMSLVRPRDVVGLDPSRRCYRQELFATERRETVPLSQAVGKFAVLSVDDYCAIRPTEIQEQHVFVCEYMLRPPATTNQMNVDNQVQADPDIVNFPFPNIVLSASLDDEYYRFKKPVRLEKETLQTIVKLEADAEKASTSVLGDVAADIDTSDWLFLKGLHTTPKLGARSKSGYILFSAVVRKKIMAENPDSSFGDISKIVGQEWKKLSDDDKKRYEEEASRIAQEREKADAAAGGRQALQPGQIRVYCCKWKECDYQFETTDQLFDHITTAHTSQIVDGENQYVCLWLTCVKYRKDGKPFPSLPRLHRHIKDKHLPTSSKCMQPQNKSKHYVPLALQPSSPQASPKPADTPQPYQAPGPSTPLATQPATTPTPQVVYYQQPASGQAGATRLLVDGQGNVLPGQQVVIYQVQQPQANSTGSTQFPAQPFVGQPNSVAGSAQQQAMTRGDPGRVVVQAPQQPVEPVFVAPPQQRVQRVVHSDVYTRYIEGLCSQQPTNSRWDRSLGAATEGPPPLPTRNLPSHMIHQLPETKEELGNVLLNLRNHIMKDTLGLKQIVDAAHAYLHL